MVIIANLHRLNRCLFQEDRKEDVNHVAVGLTDGGLQKGLRLDSKTSDRF